MRFRSYVNHAIFCRERRFFYHLGIGLDQAVASQYHYKFRIVLDVLPYFDWVLWVDDDVYFTDMKSSNIEDLARNADLRKSFLVLAEGPREEDGTWTTLNSGVMLIKNDPRSFSFLETAASLSLVTVERWWNVDEHGLFTHGDQDAITYLTYLSGDPDSGIEIVNHRQLNSRPHHYADSLEEAFAVHFCGPGDKRLKVAEFARRFGVGQELVPQHLLDKWSVRRREVVGRGETGFRRWRWEGIQLARRVRRKVRFIREERRWR